MIPTTKADEELRDQARVLRSAIPEVYTAYADLHRAAITDGVLSAKHKELIGLAIAVTDRKSVV